jgi:putative oxidoreductase
MVDMLRDLALFVARQAIGQSMAAHGAQKALGWFEGPGPEAAGAMLHGLGFRPGTTYARLAAYTEIVSGELIALGAGGPIGPAMLISTMIVAQSSVHWKSGFFAQKGGIELGVVYGAAALAFAASDYGAISADGLLGLRERFKSPVLLALALAGAIAGAVVILEQRQTAPETPATPTYQGANSPLQPSAND